MTEREQQLEAAVRGALNALGHDHAAHAAHNLDGALDDANERGWDVICSRTVKRVVGQVGMAMKILAGTQQGTSAGRDVP